MNFALQDHSGAGLNSDSSKPASSQGAGLLMVSESPSPWQPLQQEAQDSLQQLNAKGTVVAHSSNLKCWLRSASERIDLCHCSRGCNKGFQWCETQKGQEDFKRSSWAGVQLGQLTNWYFSPMELIISFRIGLSECLAKFTYLGKFK